MMDLRRCLLISSSVVHPTKYLEHAAPYIEDFLAKQYPNKDVPVLFIPYAKKDHDAYEKQANDAFQKFGYKILSIHRQEPTKAVEEAKVVFVGGGNTFRLLKTLHDLNLVEKLRSKILSGIPYMGASAGTNIATVNIRTTNDMPIVFPPSFDALNLVPFNINPHYLDADPTTTHQGETREQRLKEFHEENTNPVVGLREGSILRIEGNDIKLLGSRPSRIFYHDKPPTEHEPNTSLSFLLE